MGKLLEQYRRLLYDYESVLPYALLGLIGGIASGLIVLAFEWTIVLLAELWGVGHRGDGFENLPSWQQFCLPLGGALVLGIVFSVLKPENRETGIVHVLSRMHTHYGILPARNALLQFIGGAFALASGQSGGREGPGVHLGGAVNSLLGQWLSLPHNSLRILIACGTAGGISAAFQTPLAGVIFAMEVIIAEYTVVGFIPVMLAAVSASAISHGLSATGALFELPPLQLRSMLELPYIILLGFACGIAASTFIAIARNTSRLNHWPVVLRFTLAGAITGSLALLAPQILGLGYDTLDLALHGQVALATLLVVAICKLLATAVSVGVGMPIGLIGPHLVVGACIGNVFGTAAAVYDNQLFSDQALYIVIGMGAAMGAVLNAPLAAILAVVELTQSIGLSMAAMLAIVTATLTNASLFGQRSAHQMALQQLERNVPDDPLNQLLHSTSVSSTMDSRVVRVPVLISADDIIQLLGAAPAWCLLERDDEDLYLVHGDELLEWLKSEEHEDPTDITQAGIRRWTITPVPLQATLRQAMDAMRTQTAEAVYVYERSHNTGKRLLHGVLTRESIEKFTLSGML